MSDSGPKILRDVTCSAPVNIAIVKYWGKRDETLHLPLNGSLSLTLDQRHLATKTRIRLSRDYDADRLFLNEEESPINKRVATCLDEIRRRSHKRSYTPDKTQETSSSPPVTPFFDSSVRVRIDSWNDFPTAAGLASSAAGYACLVFALAKAFRVGGEISDIARRGSGSACRSIYGGFVEWDPGFDATPSVARQLFPSSHWSDLRVAIVVVSDQRKSTPSSEGMKRSVATSGLLRHRADVVVPARLEALRRAIADKDFESLAEIAMKESNSLHAACLDTFPPLKYLNETSHDLIDFVHAINAHFNRAVLCYTFDAGPNAFLFFPAKEETFVRRLLSRVFHLDPDDDRLVRGMKPEVAEKDETVDVRVKPEDTGKSRNDQTVDERIEDLLRSSDDERTNRLRGAVKFLIYTRPGPGPRVLEQES